MPKVAVVRVGRDHIRVTVDPDVTVVQVLQRVKNSLHGGSNCIEFVEWSECTD